MHVKVCGVRTPEAAAACADAGVDFVGFNFVQGRRRCVSLQQAKSLLPLVGIAKPVGVFLNASPQQVLEVVDALSLQWVQLHGEENVEAFRPVLRRCSVIKALSYRTFFEKESPWISKSQWLLVDGTEPGSGAGWSWSQLAQRSHLDIPIMLAGGLTPTNIQSAIQQARPDGVDAASGLEQDGSLSPQRIFSFVSQAHSALVEV